MASRGISGSLGRRGGQKGGTQAVLAMLSDLDAPPTPALPAWPGSRVVMPLGRQVVPVSCEAPQRPGSL